MLKAIYEFLAFWNYSKLPTPTDKFQKRYEAYQSDEARAARAAKFS